MPKTPGFYLFTGDWMKNPDLSVCSHFVRGLLLDVLCIASECTPRGVLEVAGRALTVEQLSTIIRGDYQANQQGIRDLIEAELIKRKTDGTLFISWILRDEKTREYRSNAGKTSAKVKQERQQKLNKPATNDQQPLQQNAQQTGNKEVNKKGVFPTQPNPLPILSSSDPLPDSSNLRSSFVPIQPKTGRTNDLETEDFQKFWGHIEKSIRRNVEPETFERLYAGIRIVNMTAAHVVLAVNESLMMRHGEQTSSHLWGIIENADGTFMRGRKLEIVSIARLMESMPA